jgi:hypothetical protein
MGKIMITQIYKRSFLLLLTISLVACSSHQNTNLVPVEVPTQQATTEGEVEALITGGHDTDPRDGGRPVALIASMLGVPSEVFREAFSHVHPASAGQEPNPIQVRLNKAALLDVLEPYGVTNDYLDEVSNYYRYNGQAEETWPEIPAMVTAILTDGEVTGFVITNPGSGYTTPPDITVLNSDVKATATLSFTTDFSTNGSIASITVDP